MSRNWSLSRKTGEKWDISINKSSNNLKTNKDDIKLDCSIAQNERKTKENQKKGGNEPQKQKYGKDDRLLDNETESSNVEMPKRRDLYQRKNTLHNLVNGLYGQVTHPKDTNHIDHLYPREVKQKNINKSPSKSYPNNQQSYSVLFYWKEYSKPEAEPSLKWAKISKMKAVNRLYEDHKERQTRMEKRMIIQKKKLLKITKSRTSRSRKEKQIKEERDKYTKQIKKIDKEEQRIREEKKKLKEEKQKLRGEKKKIQREHQERIEMVKNSLESLKEEYQNVEIHKKESISEDKLKNFKTIENRPSSPLKPKIKHPKEDRKLLIKTPPKTSNPTLPTQNPNSTLPTPRLHNPSSYPPTIIPRPPPFFPRFCAIKSHRISPIKQKEILQESSLNPLHTQRATKHSHRRDRLTKEISKHAQVKNLAKNKSNRAKTDRLRKISGSNLPQAPVSNELFTNNQKLPNRVSPQSQRTSAQKPKKPANPSFKPNYKRVCQANPSRFLTQAAKPPISNFSRRVYKREIRKEETHQKEVTKETGMVNKPFLMKGKERARCLNPAQRRDERLLHDPVTKLEKISEWSTNEIKNLGPQQNGKIERNSKISNMNSEEPNFELREKSQLNTSRNFDEKSNKTGNHLLKDKPTSITSSQSTQEETKEDSPFSQKKTPPKSINKELPKIESPSIAPKTEEKQEKAFLIPSKGLRNPSLDWFFNASLQCLISASSFIKSFLSQTNLHDSLEEIEEEPTVTGKFKDFINTYFNSSDDVITAQELRASFIEDFPKSQQHDSTQFILSLFEKLQEEHNKNVPAFKSSGHKSSQAAWENYQKDHTSIIDQLFVGMNQNSFRWQKCSYGPKIYEEFNYIPVCFEEDQKNYKINFKKICSTRESSEFFCKKWKDITSCIIENKIVKFPQYLLLPFQRSSMKSMEKRDELMKYEEEFSIDIDKGKTKHYSLISVICYHKTFSSGHYESYCKRGDTWIYCCNSTIKKVDYPHNKKDAYILLYESK